MSRLAAPKIDRSKLREAIGKLGDEYVFYLLDEALDLVPEAKLAKLVGKYLDVKDLRLDAGTRIDLFADVETFKTRSLAGGFYEDFNVNSKNCMELSRGTRAWIAQCCRLFDSIVEMPAKSDAGKVAAAFEVLLAGVEMAARAATGGPAAAGPAGSQSVFSTRDRSLRSTPRAQRQEAPGRRAPADFPPSTTESMRRKRTRFRFNEADLRSRSRERPRASSPLAEHRRRVRAPLRLETTWARALALETWTAEHVRQGFAWRPGSVSFRTLEEAGEIDIAVSLTHAVDELGSTAARIIDVPFTVPESGDIEVACITAGFPLALPSGACSLRFEHGIGKDQRMWAKLCFHPATTVVTPRIVRADAELMPPAVLLMEVLPA